jgi:prolyl oligopeptidase
MVWRAFQEMREGTVETLFGVRVSDPDRWLEDGAAPEVIAWADERDRRARGLLEGLPERDALRHRLEEVVYVEHRSVPVERGGRLFYSEKASRSEKATVYVRDGTSAAPRVLLDPLALSEDGSVSIGGFYPSRDGRRVAYLERPNNGDRSTLRVMDVDTGSVLEGDSIDHLRYTEPSWLPDGSGLLYTWTPPDPSTPAHELFARAEVRLHRLGSPVDEDEVIFAALGEPTKLPAASISADGAFLLVYVFEGWSRCDVFLRRLDDATFVPLAVSRNARFSVESFEGALYVHTNDEASGGRVFRVEPDRIGRASWQEVVAEEPASIIQEMGIVGGHMVLHRLRQAHSVLELRRLDGTLRCELPLPGPGTASLPLGRPESDRAFHAFSSLSHPHAIFELSVASATVREVFEQRVPVRTDDFEVKQAHYPSRDGTRVSMFVVHRRGLVLDGESPTLLYGYGGFDTSMLSQFNASLFPWLERGGVYAVPNLRGGGEYGEAWHRAGMREQKQNVFDDFIAAAEYLIDSGYTRPERLAISGGSNGGLLVGAVMTQRPELFRAVICAVPVLDMLRFAEVGAGPAWIPEYGDPSVEEDFRFLLAYSPYHHVHESVRYPALLVETADTDDRVDPMHARKFVAAVERASTRERLRALLRVDRNAGHGGADLRREAVLRMADEYAFLLAALDDDEGAADGSESP